MRRNWITILPLVLLVSFVNLSTARETKEITCTGKVVDSNARPLAGAEVAAYERFYNYSSGQEYTKILGQVKKTDVNGYFVLNTHISSQRNVFIVARKKGMAVGWDVLNSGISINTSYNTKGNFLIILEKPGTLAGTVVDEMDNPIAGARVRALPETSNLSLVYQRPILAPEQWFTTQTDAKGKFSFNNFAADVSCDFWVEASGWASVYKYTLSSCGFAVGRTDVRLVLPPEAPIQGRVVEVESENPIAGVSLLIQPENIEEHLNPYCPNLIVSGQDGQFSFEGIPAGKHLLKVISPEKEMAKWVGKSVNLNVQQGQATKDVTIEVEKGGIIETVVRKGTTKKPLHNIRVVAYNESSSGRAWTNAEGVARIRVPTGEFNFYVGGEGYSSYRANEPITVAKGQTTQMEILLDRNPGASGVVLDETGRPVAGALVRAYPVGDEVLTDSNGRFEFEIGFDQSRPCICLFARYVERNLAAIVETRGDSKPMKVTLKPALSIAWQITDTNGVGIPAARFSLCMHLNNYVSEVGSEVLADAKGKYQMRAIPPEQSGFLYRISVNASGYGRKQLERISITGEPGTPMEMKIMLQPADQSISGVVVDAEGKPASKVPIFLRGRDQPERSTATDKNGRFIITRICKGQLRLQANFSSSPGGSGSLEARGGDKDVKIILGQRLVHTKYVSLIGKPLPELKDLKIDLSLANVSDKMLLVCFWDMNQRPSRNCLRQLSKRAQELKAKDIVVVAVQSSQISENKLNKWIKKYNIPFTVGMINGDVEKTRFDWGVRSLPWLILIDRKHIVRAEGFNVDELDERLGQIAGTEPVMENNESTGPKLRTVRFPMSRSVGRLYVGELRLLDPHWWTGWQDAGPARGDVKVPVDKALRLDVTKEGLKELSALAACKPDDIQVVSFSYADVDDAGLGHLARLTGLKMLVSPRVGDTGLAHISKLTSLISLILRRGTFTDDGLKYISNLSSLQRLNLDYTEVTDVGLVHLRGLSSLRYLGLDYNKSVSDAGFVHLRSLNSLERMTLYGTNITGSGFSHLEGISSLREILLNHSAITDEGLGDIAKLKSLEKLSLFNTKISDVGIVHLQALGSLRELSLSGTSVSDAGLDYIGRLTSLESLDLPDWTTDAGLLKLKGLKGLKQLDLGRTQMTGIGLEPLKAFELLESLRLPRGVSDKDLAIIKEFTLLEELSIHNSPITDVGMGYLTALKSLRKLTLSNVEVTDVGYAKLGELSNLEDLTILANRNRQEYAIGDQGLAGVAKLKGLKILDLRAPNLTDAGFKHLGKLRSLQEMELKEIKITDAGFVHIGRLRSLRRLWLPSSDICDAGLRHLAELNSLQDLSLQLSGGNTAGLLHLKSLRSLSQLIVSGITFTEDSLQHLKEISPGLRSVHIGTEGISEEDAKRIEQQVPNCSIIVFAPLSIRRPLPPKPIPPHALVGKALPKFVGINIDFGPSQARDRMILVCFWDMEQRPSRNCIMRLAKQAEQLKQKGVTVVAIQASKIDENTLNEWMKKYHVPFPVRMVKGDVEKTKFAWGVRSLPWLILTDQEHIVRSNGFSLAELNEKIQAAEK